MRRCVIGCCFAAVILLTYPSRLPAQAVANATIQGEITDASGAGIPNAQIKATQTDTGQVLSTVSGTNGTYVLPNLPVGLRASASRARSRNAH